MKTFKQFIFESSVLTPTVKILKSVKSVPAGRGRMKQILQYEHRPVEIHKNPSVYNLRRIGNEHGETRGLYHPDTDTFYAFHPDALHEHVKDALATTGAHHIPGIEKAWHVNVNHKTKEIYADSPERAKVGNDYDEDQRISYETVNALKKSKQMQKIFGNKKYGISAGNTHISLGYDT